MPVRRTSLPDRCILEADAALRTVLGVWDSGGRASPAQQVPEPVLSPAEQDLAARLMRVNHAGEIAAQALYRGQALVARNESLRAGLLRAADAERDHLRWCAERTRDLGKNVSLLTPLWYLGSLALGAVAGLAGDRVSIDFLAETERQVAEHLDGHLERLPGRDARSRAILLTMRAEELGHRSDALEQGARAAPGPVRLAMRLASRVMTTVAHYV
jgi:ubiquinone biosynthesis monooxygenase Coq7